MSAVVPFAPTRLSGVTDRLAIICCQHLLEWPDRPVPVPTLFRRLDVDPGLARRALDGLVGCGRVDVALFPQRFRPHVPVLAVVRIDDLSLRTDREPPGPPGPRPSGRTPPRPHAVPDEGVTG